MDAIIGDKYRGNYTKIVSVLKHNYPSQLDQDDSYQQEADLKKGVCHAAVLRI